MEEQFPRTPLAALRGERPVAPAWFEAALRKVPERGFVPVAGAQIETLTWGETGKPGLLLLHGSGAHADWWSFIAPFFADDYRVVAMSWSGMGRSDWRNSYTFDLHVEELIGVAQATGLFDAAVKPIVVGHSFGGFPTAAAAARHGEKLGGVVLLDSPIMSPEKRAARRAKMGPSREPHATAVYPNVEAALARFRFMPVQPAENLYIVDFIARTSLREVKGKNGAGWTWCFDPHLWKDYQRGETSVDVKNATCPVAVVWGALSNLLDEENLAYTRDLLAPGAPMLLIPEAHHHVMIDQPLALVTALRGLFAAGFGQRPTLEAGAQAPHPKISAIG
jgi:pimeloyl-ACP methyl ester carboxylesterase